MSQGLSMQAVLPELVPSVQYVHPQQLQALQKSKGLLTTMELLCLCLQPNPIYQGNCNFLKTLSHYSQSVHLSLRPACCCRYWDVLWTTLHLKVFAKCPLVLVMLDMGTEFHENLLAAKATCFITKICCKNICINTVSSKILVRIKHKKTSCGLILWLN